MSERVQRSVMNMKVGMFFYVLTLFLAFFSRKVFLDCLGAEFIGLTGMLMNIMSFLSVAELGIGTSIVYFLYKPLQTNDRAKINEIMSMLAFLYRCIGGIIAVAGLAVSVFFPWWFGHLEAGLPLVYFAFYSFLASSVVGYLFNYRQLLVSANQKQYLVNAYFQTIGIVQSVVQILLAYYYRNLYLWVAVGLVFTVIGCIVFNRRIRQLYPWLEVDLRAGRANLRHYPEILKKTRQIFVQRIKDFILYRSDDLFVGYFVSIVQVAFYGNYTIIVSKFNFLVNILSDGMNAGIGNLIAEGNQKNTMKVFWELTAIRFFIVGMVVFGLLLFIQPFIGCWFGRQYVLCDLIVYLLVFNVFIMLSRGVVEMYIGASGLFSDVWAAWTELAVNLTVTICLAPYFGIAGILMGKIVSVFFIAIFWKPYFLFSRGLHLSVSVYWRGMLPYYSLLALFVAVVILLRHYVVDPHADSLVTLLWLGAATYIPLIAVYFAVMLYTTRGMKYFVARKPKLYNAARRFLCLALLLSLAACGRHSTDTHDSDTYDDQLEELRHRYEAFHAGAPRFFLFGMGNRDKFIYKDYQLVRIDNDSVVLTVGEAISDSIMPADYRVDIQTTHGTVTICEDEHGVFVSHNGLRDTLADTSCQLSLPTFEEFRYGRVLRVLHHELLFNIRGSRPYPNIFVYREPFYRDAFMAALCLEKTGNVGLLDDWFSYISDIYDMQNGEPEADNIGELLYMLSLHSPLSTLHSAEGRLQGKNSPLAERLLQEAERLTLSSGSHRYIKGHTDGADNAAYQTAILRLALQKAGLTDEYSEPPADDAGDYRDLCWFATTASHRRSLRQLYRDLRFNYADSPFPYLQWARSHYYGNTKAAFNDQRYPLSWEKRGGSAHFEGMHIVSDKAAEERICYPHAWTAAEMFLKLYEER